MSAPQASASFELRVPNLLGRSRAPLGRLAAGGWLEGEFELLREPPVAGNTHRTHQIFLIDLAIERSNRVTGHDESPHAIHRHEIFHHGLVWCNDIL